MSERICGYCGKSKCKCHYRAGRGGGWSITVEQTSTLGTMGGLKEALNRTFAVTPPETKGFYRFSFTALDDRPQKRRKSGA